MLRRGNLSDLEDLSRSDARPKTPRTRDATKMETWWVKIQDKITGNEASVSSIRGALLERIISTKRKYATLRERGLVYTPSALREVPADAIIVPIMATGLWLTNLSKKR